jgi:hypothetical protein
LIVSLADAAAPVIKSFKIESGNVLFEEIKVIV